MCNNNTPSYWSCNFITKCILRYRVDSPFSVVVVCALYDGGSQDHHPRGTALRQCALLYWVANFFFLYKIERTKLYITLVTYLNWNGSSISLGSSQRWRWITIQYNYYSHYLWLVTIFFIFRLVFRQIFRGFEYLYQWV